MAYGNDITGSPIKFSQDKIGKVKNATTSYFRAHWIDYLLLFGICFILGAFDIFILQRSDNFLKLSYWLHSGCRIGAYILAAILGVRIGYPKAKACCEDLAYALGKNKRLIKLKELDGERFSDFINGINIDVKKNAWKAKINNKLKKLDKRAPDFFPLFYRDRKDDYFLRFNKFKAKRLKNKALAYCYKRENLEALLKEDFINSNITALNVKFPRVRETDFNQINGNDLGYKYYKTVVRVKSNASRAIGSSLIFTVLLTLVCGSVALTLDQELAQERIVAIFGIIINALIDIGLTLWRFLNGYFDSERIVREEDLHACVDKNELLVMYKKQLPEDLLTEYNNELNAELQEEAEIKKELSKA